MKPRSLYLYTLGLAMVLGLGNCEKKPQTTIKKFLITVDSMKVADTVYLPNTVDIELFGTIGQNGCYEFHELRFEQENDTTISMEVWGKKTEGDDIVCPDNIVLLDGSVIEIIIQNPGTYIMKIKNPEDLFLTDTVRVMPGE